jgi:DNA polymerase-3 subunit beta
MKATIERATLLRSLGHVQSVVERRNTIPILSNVLLEASEEGGIRLMATDLDLQINETVEANVTQAGAQHRLRPHTLLRHRPQAPRGSRSSLTPPKARCRFNAGWAKFNLSIAAAHDFPVIAEGDTADRFELPAATMRQSSTRPASPLHRGGPRYFLNGIFLHDSDEAQRV